MKKASNERSRQLVAVRRRTSPSISEQRTGVSVRATKLEMTTAIASDIPNSRKSRPTVPVRKATGRNTDTSAIVVATTAKPISRIPANAAWRRDRPISRWRKMFSSTTIASSTTRPMASTSASRVMMLMEKSSA